MSKPSTPSGSVATTQRQAALDPIAAAGSSSYGAPRMEASTTDRAATTLQPDTSWLRALSRRVWLTFSAAWAVITGLLPHVLHHAGPLAGAALLAGVGGSLLFGVIGLVVAIPFLRRMGRRFGTWRAPAIALVLFASVFSISTFVVGPRISGEESTASETSAPSAAPAGVSEDEHEAHH